jgi:hypothetical protein
MARPKRVRTLFSSEPDWTDRARGCTLKVQMALSTLRISHDLSPVTTGWQMYVAAERLIAMSAANSQQPRGF